MVRGGTGKWLHHFAGLRMEYRAAQLYWVATDPSFPGLIINLAVVAATSVVGAVANLNATGAAPGDEVVWSVGGLAKVPGGRPGGWYFDCLVNPATLSWDFVPGDCKGNRVTVTPAVPTERPATFTVASTLTAGDRETVGACSAMSQTLVAADPAGWLDPVTFGKPPSSARDTPVAGQWAGQKRGWSTPAAAAMPVDYVLWLAADSITGAIDGQVGQSGASVALRPSKRPSLNFARLLAST